MNLLVSISNSKMYCSVCGAPIIVGDVFVLQMNVPSEYPRKVRLCRKCGAELFELEMRKIAHYRELLNSYAIPLASRRRYAKQREKDYQR